MKLETVLLGNRYKFSSIKEVLAKANEQKSGDSLAGIAAANAKERIAAKEVLSDLTVEEITAEPAVPANEDAVTRIIFMMSYRRFWMVNGTTSSGKEGRIPQRFAGA